MKELRQKMREDLQLRGMRAETQRMYLVAVKLLAEHYGKSPDQTGSVPTHTQRSVHERSVAELKMG